jgi:hypothetical protein
LDVALFVPLFFFWTLHCLSLCSSFGRNIPFIFTGLCKC